MSRVWATSETESSYPDKDNTGGSSMTASLDFLRTMAFIEKYYTRESYFWNRFRSYHDILDLGGLR